jgi:hypothetical protein
VNYGPPATEDGSPWLLITTNGKGEKNATNGVIEVTLVDITERKRAERPDESQGSGGWPGQERVSRQHEPSARR